MSNGKRHSSKKRKTSFGVLAKD